MDLYLKKPLVVFDLETTGINIAKDRIVEYAFLKVYPNGTKESKVQRINPQMPIPLASSLIHGIYDEDVKDAPSFKQVAKELANFLEGSDLAGFNIIRFDVPMLVEEFLRNDIDFSINNRRLIDAQKIFHLMEPRNLAAAYQFYCGKTLENAHSAEADNLATFEVLQSQITHYQGKKIKDKNGNDYEPVRNDMEALHKITAEKIIDFAGTMTYNDKGEEVFNIGKHKGKLIKDVLKQEPNYYDWFQKADFPLDSKRKLTEIKLKDAFNK
ncbi:MAG: 3'-5' exonuclease [Thermonemataceae bacterium]|nr:3'-5' exonuclease [Thermonemataceae bacterium]